MPFHKHSSSTSSSHQNAHEHPINASSSALFQAAQTLGSIATPVTNPNSKLQPHQPNSSSSAPASTALSTPTSSTAAHQLQSNNPYLPSLNATDHSVSHSQGDANSVGFATGTGPGIAATTSTAATPSFATPSFSSTSITSSNVPPTSLTEMDQSQQYGAPRRTGTYGSQQGDELHMSPHTAQQGPISPRGYGHSGPQIKLDQPASQPSASSYQSPTSVPNVLQPGGMGGSRPPSLPSNAAPNLPASGLIASPNEYSTPSRPATLSTSHSYSRSSPTAAYEAGSQYHPYTPTTPAGTASSSYMSPSELKYGAPGSQRNVSNTPLGLADIRPRADSSMSDTTPGTMGYELAHSQPGTSNYLAPWATYAFDWCKWAPQGNSAGKLALGSYLEDGHNFIQILDTHLAPTPSEIYQPGTSKYTMEFTKVAEATHSYPVTRLLWEPPSSQKQTTDLLATSGDHLRLWSLPSDASASHSNSINNKSGQGMPVTKLTPLALLSNSKTPDHTAPLTSLDWNQVSPSLIITSSIDTTCTIWDIPSLTAKTQLIAHDKEVYDVRFCANSVDVFVSCGQDGSVRMFDLRSLEHSTIIYEPTGKDDRDANGGRISPTLAQQTMTNPPPLLRLATSPHDTHLLATFAQDTNIIRILDVRQPGQALLELRGHGGSINCIEWSPSRRGTLASGGDDCQVLIWDLLNSTPNSGSTSGSEGKHLGPTASWQCDYEVGNLGWTPRLNSDAGEWLGVSGGRGVWGVHL